MMAAGHMRRMLLLVLAATGAFAMFDENEPAKKLASVEAPRSGARPAASAQRAHEPAPRVFDVSRLDRIAQRTRSEQEAKDPFGVDEPAPAAKSEPAPPPPPSPPQAPELPFRFLGSQETGGRQTIFLEQQQETHIVSIGETIAGAWRLDALDSRTAVFTYLPLGQQKSLPLGGPG